MPPLVAAFSGGNDSPPDDVALEELQKLVEPIMSLSSTGKARLNESLHCG